MNFLILYIAIGFLWEGNNLRMLVKSQKNTYPIWVHIFAWFLWPISMLDVAQSIWKTLKALEDKNKP